jgi:alcohol dehydrogenase class IV
MTPLHSSSFSVHVPTDIRFGAGRLAEVGQVVAALGNRCLLVTGPAKGSVGRLLPRVLGYLKEAGVETAHFDGVIPNPTTDTITAGADKAKAHKADVILGLGGGSSMDAAKAIAVEATHPGNSWDYLFYRDAKPTEKTLPVVAVSTTSGTGSQVTQVSVVTHTATRDKSALYNSLIFPRVAIVDPELMVGAPKHVTACTGFDAFTHAFESVLHGNAAPYVHPLAWEAIENVITHLPAALQAPTDMEARSALAIADTLAGICIAVAGVTLPHGVGMAIGGMYPHVAHGEALALNYPAFMRYTWASAVGPFARLGRLLNPSLGNVTDEEAARRACDEMDAFLKRIGLWMGLKDKGVPREELPALARQSMVLPDYKNNPRLATEAEMLALLEDCYSR